jgi:adenosine deaminase
VRANLIGIMSRHLGEAICWSELEAAIACMGEGVVAVDLAGDEANFPGSRFVRHFARARAAGLHITVHAGEADGPASVRQAIEQLGAERIGHGVRAIEDESVMALIAERGIAIESCPPATYRPAQCPATPPTRCPSFCAVASASPWPATTPASARSTCPTSIAWPATSSA